MPVPYEYVSPGRTIDRFLTSEAFIVGVRGPFGSGKTSAGTVKVLMHANKQVVQRDKRRHSRYAIIRNTYPELTTTTIKTWHSWVPPTVGHWTSKGPPTHRIRDNSIDMEVIFVSLDREADLRKVLGMDLTGAFINEAREVPKSLIDGLSARVGRYPPVRDGGCVDPQIWMDTNSPNIGHWWQILAEQDSSTEAGTQMIDSMREAEQALREKGWLKKGQSLFEFLAQPSALSPDAENLQNLAPEYYPRLMAGKTEEWIKVYVRNEYGYVQDGRPVYPEFRQGLHVREFELDQRLPLTLGVDWGLTPAVTIGQRTLRGIHRVRWELVTQRAGAKQLADALRAFLNSTCSAFDIESVTGDPAGEAGAQTDVTETCFKILKANGITQAKPAHTNDFTLRREAHSQAMTRLIDGEPGYQVHRYGCPILIRGLSGEYRYKKLAAAGGADMYQPRPEKNEASHVCEADQYRMLGAGEGRVVVRGQLGGRRIRPAYSEM